MFDLRITGTGAAYRSKLDEFTVRDPEKWLSDEFVQRCNGLPVIFDHPKDGKNLTPEEYRERSIGTIVLPYVKGDEVWGIAKIFDDAAAVLMQTTHTSTSPGVKARSDAKPIKLEDGTKVLDEDLPAILDHLAVCELGVWDKGGPPEGVRLDAALSREDTNVTEEERKALEKERDDAKARADAAEKERDDAKKRADRAKRHDAEKHEGQHDDCAKCDAEGEPDEKKIERDDKRRGDKVAEVDADKAMELHDSVAQLKTQNERLQAQVNALLKPASYEDRDVLSRAKSRADSVYGMFGDHAPDALHGETPIAYRKRLAAGLRKYSGKFKDYTIHDSLDETAFGAIEDLIYNDAVAAAKDPRVFADAAHAGGLIKRVTRDELGRTRTEYHGSTRVGLGLFVAPSFVGKIVKPERV